MLSRSLQNSMRFSSVLTSVRGYKKTVEQLAKEKPGLLKDAKVLVRVDFNVPLSKTETGKITDDTRIREALPTIKFLTQNGAKVMLVSHCGKPKGPDDKKLRMEPIAKRLGELLNQPIATVKECIGPDVDKAVQTLKGGDILMLENVRFHKEEEENKSDFAEKLAKNADIYVNDAFGTAHRAHASTTGVCKYIKHNVAGFLMEKELKFLKSAVDNPKRPFAAVVGGSKVSTKLPVIKSLIQKCDKILLGGGMMFTFYKAQGLNIGDSLVENDFVNQAKDLLEQAKTKGVKLFLPIDVVIGKEFKEDTPSQVVDANAIPNGWRGLDIGPKSSQLFHDEIASCNTVVWNGPMGVFEFKPFAAGTVNLAKALAEVTAKGGVSIVGGGDSVAAVAQAKLTDKITHISTGGGASLELLEGQELPGVAALDNA